jgi:hypothetical protein
MFSWGGQSLNPLAGVSTGPAPEARSRSPRQSQSQPVPSHDDFAGHGHLPSPANVTPGNVQPWVTGSAVADAWMPANLEHDVLDQLAEMPAAKRKSVILGMMKNPPTNPNSWAKACVRNWREQMFERQAAGGPSPHTGMRSTGSSEQRIGSCSHYSTPNGHVSPHGALMQGPPLSAQSESMARAITGVRRQGPLFPDLPRSPAQWVQSAWTLWHTSKSNFCALIHAQLGDAVRGRFQVMPPQDQLHIGFGVMLAADTSMDLDQLVSGWCDRYDLLNNGIVSTPVPPVGTPTPGAQLSVQFILCGGVLASSNILTWVAMQCMHSCRPDLRIDLKPVIEVGYREVDVRVARGMLSSGFCDARSDAGCTPAVLNDAVIRFLPEWKEKSTKIVFVIQVPNDQNSQSRVSVAGGSPIHSKALRHLFHFRKSIATISDDLGHSNVATVVFASSTTSEVLRSELSELFGRVVEGVSTTLKYNEFAESPVVFTNPTQLSVAKNTTLAPESDKIDGWIFNSTALRSLGPAALPLNPNTLSRNACAHLLKERMLLPQEEDLLQAAKMKHAITGELRLPSRDFFGRLLGLEGSPVLKIVNEQFKCHQWIIPSTGGPAPSGLRGGEACGQSRYLS